MTAAGSQVMAHIAHHVGTPDLVVGTRRHGKCRHLTHHRKEDAMSSTRRAIAAAGVVAVLAAAIVVWAVQASSDSKKTFTVEGKLTAFTPVDLPPQGESPGDQGVLAGTLTQDGKAAGSYQGYCVNITDPGNSECTFSFALDDGQIVVTTGYGKFNGAEDSAQSPIVGGTGAYSNTRGWIEETETGEDTIRVVFHLED